MVARLCGVVTVFAAILAPPAYASPLTITIKADKTLLTSPVVRSSVDDTQSLLQQAIPSADVSINASQANIMIIVPDNLAPVRQLKPHTNVLAATRLPVPDRSYRWKSGSSNGHTVLRLQANTAEGVACGLYGLLQNKMGFRFHHPRETVIPMYERWPLPAYFTFSGRPRFEKSGFHLHTMHPIELTEQILNPDYPNGYAEVTQYIDWLVRNGQNTFQFVLLRGIDRARWPRHAARIVEYAHRRGVKCGVQISLSMLQQQSFQLITLLRPYPSYRKQVDDTLAWLFQVPWDFVSLEPTMGEHLPFLNRFIPAVQSHLERQVAERYHALLMLGTHVIGGADAPRQPQLASSGILIHTVMCYSLTEECAPVYGNRNQCFMLQTARREQPGRETWYWPESSYWVGFDTPVPLLLLPYLDVRHQDIETMAGLRVNGHLTFTSGWEWGYWLVDWSIARWSWELHDSDIIRTSDSLAPLGELLSNPRMQPLWSKALRLQNSYLKERDLMRFMAAATPFSELPHPFDKPFQPSPEFHYSRLFGSGSAKEVREQLDKPIRDLEEYSRLMAELTDTMSSKTGEDVGWKRRTTPIQKKLSQELVRALTVSSLRARHRALTLRALSARVIERSGGNGDHKGSSADLLSKARLIRLKALELVKQQELGYRYPLELVNNRRVGMTAYPFGYLYPAGRLYFWEREEKQVEEGRFDPLFMNLWDVSRTLGLGSLFVR